MLWHAIFMQILTPQGQTLGGIVGAVFLEVSVRQVPWARLALSISVVAVHVTVTERVRNVTLSIQGLKSTGARGVSPDLQFGAVLANTKAVCKTGYATSVNMYLEPSGKMAFAGVVWLVVGAKHAARGGKNRPTRVVAKFAANIGSVLHVWPSMATYMPSGVRRAV